MFALCKCDEDAGYFLSPCRGREKLLLLQSAGLSGFESKVRTREQSVTNSQASRTSLYDTVLARVLAAQRGSERLTVLGSDFGERFLLFRDDSAQDARQGSQGRRDAAISTGMI